MNTKLKVLVSLVLSATATAGGSKPADPKPPQNVVLQAKPYRYVRLARVTVPSFYLPNGQRADLNSDLSAIIDTAINTSRYVRTTNGNSTKDFVPNELILTGGITSFELDVLQLNLKVGWNQNGAIIIAPGVPGAQGELEFKLSNFSMDFKICEAKAPNVCTTYVASSTNAGLANIGFKVKVNIDQVTSSLELLYKMKIAETVRKATQIVLKQMEDRSDFDLLPWEAKVSGVDLGTNTIVFDAGQSAGILKDQVYSVYNRCDSPDCFKKWQADIKVKRVGAVTSDAAPLSDQDQIKNVYKGDSVFVKILMGPQ